MSVPLASLGPAADLLAHEIDRLHGPVTLVRRTSDLVEVLAVVRSGLARAVVVAEGAEEFGAEAMDSLLHAGAVVAVLEGHDDDRLVELGAIFLPLDATAVEAAEILIEESERALDHREHPRGRRPGPTDRDLEALTSGADDADDTGPATHSLLKDAAPRAGADSGPENVAGTPTAAADAVGDGDGDGAGSGSGDGPPTGAAVLEGHDRSGEDPVEPSGIVVVWGPHGAPGRTTVAINLAAEIAAEGHPVVLVDLDTWGPSVASLLGLLDETAGVALACRAADRQRLDRSALERAAVRVDLGRSQIEVLTGLTRSERWPELRAGSVRRLLRACRDTLQPRTGTNDTTPQEPAGPHRASEVHTAGEVAPASVTAGDQLPGGLGSPASPMVIVDVGFSLEEDEELSFDTQAPRRNAATLTALAEADVVVAVVSADVLGVPRGAKSLPTVMEHTSAEVLVVANKVRKAAAGRSPRAGVREAWEAAGAVIPISSYVTVDPATLDRAALDGSVLMEAASTSTVRAELRTLAQRVVTRLRGETIAPVQEEVITGTSFGRRMRGWLRR